MVKQIGLIGLGNMGENIALNLLSKNYKLVVYNRSIEKTKQLKHGSIPSYSLEEFLTKLNSPRVILLMLTAGSPVDQVINQLTTSLNKGDIIIDGGNSHFKDSVRRYNYLKSKSIHFIDIGVSGGITGARNGTSLTIGGDKPIFKKIEFLFRDLSKKNGYAYLGNAGAGHFAKMIHNGIEYALLQSYAEGFEIIKKSEYNYDLKKIARVWNNGSIIESHILSLIEDVLLKNPNLKDIKGIIGGGQTGQWAYKESKSIGVEFGTLKHSLEKRKSSEKKQSFSTKLISALRNEFGGHKAQK